MSENPLLMAMIKKPEQELAEKTEKITELKSLSELDQELAHKRAQVNVQARISDIRHITRLDELAETILEALNTPEAKVELKKAIHNMIKCGDFKGLQALVTSLGLTMDKRESLLMQTDPERESTVAKKRLKLNVVWQGADGQKVGVQAETSE